MSDDELERRLERLEPVAPRVGLRGEILARLREEPAAEGGVLGRLDRWLARPTPWAAAAALLILLVGAAWALDHRVDKLARGPVATRREGGIRRLEEEIAAAVPDGPARDALLRRIRLRLTRAPTWPVVWSGGSS